MTPLQLEFFNAADNHQKQAKEKQKQAEKARNQLRQLFVGVLSTGLVLTTGLAVFAVFQLQQVQRQRVEQLAATAQAKLSSQPVDAQVNAIAAIGLARSPFVKFPNHPLSASIQDSLLDVILVNKEQNQLQHTYAVYSVDFSPDGKQIVSGSLDNTVRLWNAATAQPIGNPLSGHTDPVNSVAFSPDGKQIVSGSSDNTVRLWDVSWESWLQTACKQLRHHAILVNPETDVAKEAKKTCIAFEPQR